ncbi:hypothetical protein SO802_009881 [Lithocarpus litseifolius]|uniref:RNase H type-1 domain-containing protein n=1 Tax=Lithocarpus litseifolius TaxID=425828 RepID=A0AAW2DFM7_9ROSI
MTPKYKLHTPKVTRGGGLVLFWKKDFDLKIESSSLNHIDVIIKAGKENAWRFTGFYGAPETQLRSESWNLLRDLDGQSPLPWLCAGDFNELLKSHEKLGGRLRSYGQMQLFREALDECGLFDLNFIGKKFTWFKHYPNGGSVWERLDRAVCTAEWFSLFPATKVRTLSCVSSDHNPIIILPDGIAPKKLKPWRFEQLWLECEGCHDTITAAWSEVSWASPMVEVMNKIENCKNQLRRWSKNSVCNISNTLVEKKKSLELAEAAAVRGGSMDFFLQLKSEVNDLLRMEEKLWQQRAHDHWMVSGDKNSGYFHNRASQKFRRNTITELKGSNGEMVLGDDEIAALVVGYYNTLFSSSTPSHIEDVLQHTLRVVIRSLKQNLHRVLLPGRVSCLRENLLRRMLGGGLEMVPSLPLVQIGVFAQDYLRSFKTRVSQASHSTGSGHPSQKHWLPPPPECFKDNFDGAMFNESDEAGLGVVIRNSRGQVMVALSEKIKKPPSVVALELLAARRAAVLVSETGFQNSVFEGDSLAVVKSLQGSGMENSAVGHILKDTLSIVSLLKSFSFSHVIRQGNAVAHALAQRARLSFPLQVWMESVPPDLNAVLLADLQPSVLML